MSMANRNEWMAHLKQMVDNSPFKTSAILSFILFWLEKLLAINFECPCSNAEHNGTFSSAFFAIPFLVAFLVMLIIECHNCKRSAKCCKCLEKCCFRCVSVVSPPMVWLIMTFLDGEYLDCAMTARNGKYVQIAGDPTHRWCKPWNNTENEIQLLQNSKDNMALSQYIGIWMLYGLCFAIALLVLLQWIISKCNC